MQGDGRYFRLGDRDCRPVERPTFLQRVAVEVVHVRFAEDGGAGTVDPAGLLRRERGVGCTQARTCSIPAGAGGS